jgi:hypothetical protein
MTELEDAMYQHMAYLVLLEGRPFYYGDFTRFEVNGRKYEPSYGTIRNKFSKLEKQGKIKVNCNSKPVFYELKESNLHYKSMTVTHTGGLIVTNISHNDPLYTRLKTLPMGNQSIHDIRITFLVPHIYETFAINTTFDKEDYSGDIRPFKCWNVNNASIQITIHKSNTVSVILACSQEPFPLDLSGIVAFFSTLSDIHGLLVGVMLSIYGQKINEIENRTIPPLSDWTIKMWHFGRDSLIEYSGKDVHDTVERAKHVLERVYPKIIKSKRILRHEFQEYPNKTVFDAIEDKLNYVNSDNVTHTNNAISVEDFP